MSRLQSYILNEGRTRSISEDKAFEILETKCKQAVEFVKKGNYIIRDITGFNDDYGIIYPKPSERKSRNTSNYYTLIINNDPAWKAFPKREVICLYSDHYYYGDYIVYPFDGAKIGVCPSSDMWGSFDNFQPDLINTFLDTLLNNYCTYNEMKKKLSNIKDLEKIEGGEYNIVYGGITSIIRNGNFKNLWDAVMSVYGNPKKYGFSVVNIGSYILTKRNREVEVWTDSPCLMVRKIV